MGPGTAMSAKYPVATWAANVNMMPLAASNPATRCDLWFHDTANAAVASTMVLREPLVQTMQVQPQVQARSARPAVHAMAAATIRCRQKKA